MYETTREYIKSCDQCQRREKQVRKEEIKPLIIGQPFSRIGINIKGPLPITKNNHRYIIVVVA